jgi:hypothetical protein
LGIQQDVVGFQVSVYDAIVMAVFDCTHDLLEQAVGLILGQATGLSDMLQELPPTGMFHDDIYIVHCFDHLKQLDYIGMAQFSV